MINQNQNLYPRGSKWRKWDLHIHSDSGSPEEIVDKLIEGGPEAFRKREQKYGFK